MSGLAREVFDYLCARDRLRTAALVIGFGHFDFKVADRCAQIHLDELAPTILFSGGRGRATGPEITGSEAEAFHRRALELGVTDCDIQIERCSANALENVKFSKRAIESTLSKTEGPAIIVANPCHQRRMWLTCTRQIPGIELINAPPVSCFEDEVKLYAKYGFDYVAWIVGEVKRIIRYGGKGDITYEEVPPSILRACGVLEARVGSRCAL
ncbi:YdcF family protein [bacterium]|nr:YdcF family protein [bacterium]